MATQTAGAPAPPAAGLGGGTGGFQPCSRCPLPGSKVLACVTGGLAAKRFIFLSLGRGRVNSRVKVSQKVKAAFSTELSISPGWDGDRGLSATRASSLHNQLRSTSNFLPRSLGDTLSVGELERAGGRCQRAAAPERMHAKPEGDLGTMGCVPFILEVASVFPACGASRPLGAHTGRLPICASCLWHGAVGHACLTSVCSPQVSIHSLSVER